MIFATSSATRKRRCLFERGLRSGITTVMCTALVGTANAHINVDTVFSGRALEMHEARHQCGQQIDRVSKEELVDIATKSAEALDPETAGFVTTFILPFINFGIQLMKICASCKDFQAERLASEGSTNNAFVDYCGPEAYGNNATVSGLALMPFTNSSDDPMGIPPGPMKGAIWTHGSQSQTFRNIPSEETFDREDLRGLLSAALLAFPSLYAGAVTILPDYLGYGESHDFYKSYLIKRAYQTSTMPLWLKAKELIRAETNCSSDLVDVATVNGYSEGGYAAVAVSEAMANTGVDILGTYAGAGPYRLSSTLLLEGTRLFDEGLYPSSGQYYLALWGSAYSSTNPDLPNYGLNQNFVADEHRADVVRWVEEGYPSSEINELIPDDDPLSLGNPEVTGFLRRALTENDTAPCVGYDASFVGVIDKICEAFVENDLTNYLENEARHPIDLCHSPKDDKVMWENVAHLDLDANPLLTHSPVTGDHSNAFVPCFLVYTNFLASDSYRNAPVEFSEMCAGAAEPVEKAPTVATVEPTISPVEDGGDGEAASGDANDSVDAKSLAAGFHPKSSVASWLTGGALLLSVGHLFV